ncbi:hypothetical protein JNK13_10395 [bacterium]|nr:hypothetical protein [bacterium]
MKSRKLNVLSSIIGSSALVLFTQAAFAETNYATPERREAAVGHYARARTLLVEALQEFDRGRRVARPDLLVDVEEWRTSVITRAEELNRVLDPKPRVSRSGVRFKANPLLIRDEQKQNTYVSPDGPQDSNTYGEEQFERESKAAQTSPTVVAPLSSVTTDTTSTKAVTSTDSTSPAVTSAEPAPAETVTTPEIQKAPTSTETTTASTPDIKAELPAAAQAPTTTEVAAPTTTTDSDVEKAIAEAVKARLDKYSEVQAPAAATTESPAAGSTTATN